MLQLPELSSIYSAPNHRWGNWLSWFAITFLTLGSLLMSLSNLPESENEINPPRISAIDLSQLELEGKNLVLQHSLKKTAAIQLLVKDEEADEAIDEDTEEVADKKVNEKPSRLSVVPDRMDEGTINQRWCYSILLNELESPTKALEHLSLTTKRLASAKLELNERQKRVHQLLEKSFEACDRGEFLHSNLKPEDVDLLREQLGWYTDLLIASDRTQPELRSSITNEAKSNFALSVFLLFGGGLALFGGVVLFALMAFFIYAGTFEPGFTNQPSRHYLYLQTFAIWMVIFIGGQVLMALVLDAMNLADPASRLGCGLIPFLGSLVALAWPWVRGVELKDLLADIGWKKQNPWIEVGSGIAYYLMLLPFMFLAMLFFIGLTKLSARTPTDFSTGNKPSHPIQEIVAQGDDTTTILLVVLMACVAAPVVEETMFRGAFYRYLRDANCHRARWLSVALATIVNSSIFAALHPQGLMALPLLGTLAIGFSLAREQNDSLIAPMVMHGINNGIVSLLLFSMF